MQLQVLLVVCLVGLVHSNTINNPGQPQTRPQMTMEEMSNALYEFEDNLEKAVADVQRVKHIGQLQIRKLDSMVDKSGQAGTCVYLDFPPTRKPPTSPPDPTPPAPGPQLTLAEMSAKLYALEWGLGRATLAVDRYKTVGRTQLEKVSSFIEGVKRGVCGAPENPCEDGFSHFDGSCYKELVLGDKKSWDDAQASCHAHNSNAHLTIIDSVEENEFIHSLFVRNGDVGGHSGWIGLNRQLTMDWTWVHTTIAPTYTNWSAGKLAAANEKCTYLCLQSKTWGPKMCNVQKRYMCEMPVA